MLELWLAGHRIDDRIDQGIDAAAGSEVIIPVHRNEYAALALIPRDPHPRQHLPPRRFQPGQTIVLHTELGGIERMDLREWLCDMGRQPR